MIKQIRFASHPEDVKKYTTKQLRDHYLLENIMEAGEITATYAMHDRLVTLGVVPTENTISLPSIDDFTKASFFTERRELGIINVGGAGTVMVDGEAFSLDKKECLYIGKGKQEITFGSEAADAPAEFYINSCPAHKTYPTQKGTIKDATRVDLGSKTSCNERTIFQYIHADGIQSCQLVMGFTELKNGSIWNTFPPHTHLRRMEVYFYFDLPKDQIVLHLMGKPEETRHLVLNNKQAVISPEWSIHAGAGSSAYSFIWAMAGENKEFTDMDGCKLEQIR